VTLSWLGSGLYFWQAKIVLEEESIHELLRTTYTQLTSKAWKPK